MLRKTILIIACAAFLTGCGSAKSIQRGPDIALPYGAKVSQIRVSLQRSSIDSDEYEAFQENKIDRTIREELASELSDKGIYGGYGDIVVEVRVTKGRLRSALSAAVFSGLDGVDKLYADISVRTSNGRLLKRFETRAEFGSGGLLGTTQSSRIALLAENLAEEISEHF